MKIYTKTGDKGTTSLVGGKRVPKYHPRVEAYGDVDELISCIGVVISDAPAGAERDFLRKIQENLMLASAHLASDGSVKKLKEMPEDAIAALESEIDRMTAAIPAQTAFILPGAPRVSSECHVARTVCRRAERHALLILNGLCDGSGTGVGVGFEVGAEVGAAGEVPGASADENLRTSIKYLNRLSDYLFTLGRFYCHTCGGEEVFWLP